MMRKKSIWEETIRRDKKYFKEGEKSKAITTTRQKTCRTTNSRTRTKQTALGGEGGHGELDLDAL